MSIRENIQCFSLFDPSEYLKILIDEYGAERHPSQEGAFLIDGLPFYAPKQSNEHIFILGFNMVPLPHVLIQALINHPELAPEPTFINWTIEQELIAEGTIADFRTKFEEK